MVPLGGLTVKTPLDAACAALRRGEIVCLYDADGREEETDMVVASQFATPEAIRRLRMDAGGLVCTTVAPEHHRKLGLPFLADLVRGMASTHPILAKLNADDIRYDPSKSSFGITINHRSTFTGVPDTDRSFTVQHLARLLSDCDTLGSSAAQGAFGAAFRSPGHVILLNGAEGGLARRQGHTELSLELARQAGLVPSTTICEMLSPAPVDGNDRDAGRALGKRAAREYAERHGLVFLTGQDVIEAWQANPRAQPEKPVQPQGRRHQASTSKPRAAKPRLAATAPALAPMVDPTSA